MTQLIEPNQHSIAEFASQDEAQRVINALQTAGFSSDRLALLLKDPPVTATEAKNSGIQGAVIGALSGGIAGLFLSLIKTGAVGGIPDVDPIRNMVGLVLAGSFVGAASIGLIAALTGVNVRKGKDGSGTNALIPTFVLFAKDLQPDEVTHAKEVVQSLQKASDSDNTSPIDS